MIAFLAISMTHILSSNIFSCNFCRDVGISPYFDISQINNDRHMYTAFMVESVIWLFRTIIDSLGFQIPVNLMLTNILISLCLFSGSRIIPLSRARLSYHTIYLIAFICPFFQKTKWKSYTFMDAKSNTWKWACIIAVVQWNNFLYVLDYDEIQNVRIGTVCLFHHLFIFIINPVVPNKYEELIFLCN